MILKNGGERAAEILNYFEKNRELTDPLREMLVDLIIKAKRVLTRDMMNDAAHQICEIFVGETKVFHLLKAL